MVTDDSAELAQYRKATGHDIDDSRQLLAECDGSGPGASARNEG